MAVSIDQSFVDGFRDVLRHLSQQKTSKFRPYTDQYSPEAETGNWDRLGLAEAAPKVRGAATPNSERVWSRRIAVASPFNDAELTEVEDPSMMLIDPNSNFVKSLGYSMGRSMDDLIINAAIGNALNSVRAGDGSNTPTNIALPAGQIIGDYTAPISFDMVTEVIEKFNTNDIDMDEPKVAFIGPRQIRELMNLTEQTSADYVQAQALQQNGIVPNWMGFTWIMSTRLHALTPAATNKDLIFMTYDAVGFHIPEDITTFVKRDASVQYAWRPYCQYTAGAVRVEDEKVVVARVEDLTVT